MENTQSQLLKSYKKERLKSWRAKGSAHIVGKGSQGEPKESRKKKMKAEINEIENVASKQFNRTRTDSFEMINITDQLWQDGGEK